MFSVRKDGEHMSRFKVICDAAIFLALLIVGVTWFTNGATATPVKQPAPPPVHHHFQIAQSYVAGSPAIHPHASLNTSGAAFTQADVIAFFNTYGFFAGPVVKGAHLKILTIQFVSAKQASQLMYGENVDRPDDYLVCYVKVEGPFLLTGVRGGPNLPNVGHPTMAKLGDAVFDAHTGNLLGWGVYFQ